MPQLRTFTCRGGILNERQVTSTPIDALYGDNWAYSAEKVCNLPLRCLNLAQRRIEFYGLLLMNANKAWKKVCWRRVFSLRRFCSGWIAQTEISNIIERVGAARLVFPVGCDRSDRGTSFYRHRARSRSIKSESAFNGEQYDQK